MKRFCAENLKRLLDVLRTESAAGNNRQEAAEDLETVRDSLRDCIGYVLCVAGGENELNFLGVATEEYRDYVSRYDTERHVKHEKAIAGASMLNRFAELYLGNSVEDTVIFTGDIRDRHQVAEFCLELVEKLFMDRRMIL